ncbi:inorganic diphosphatase [Mucilaginibacter sp. Bleaf8]|uniref:inorganic diphosphatase n=1 Tax=Mucilaginibacter sp. Bleaf8 TaxID=2834430 RepID=UPI001BCEB9B1|nr:inorganic diphosphatase [Mucilaginibacter sp. Bleaf8]MBS7564064.1 inorganic diphosphatase [Mucilaginibacter sp. Bleaf8]
MKPVMAIIESPKGSGHKYDYEPDLKCFKLAKVMPAGLVFPFDFGFIPNTKGEDGDPLDVIVISEIETFPGCCMDCRIIGCIKAEQTEEDGETVRNDRFLAVPEVSQLFKEINAYDHLPEGIITQIENFFKNYNDQAGKKFKVLDRLGPQDAYNVIVGM